MVEMLGIKMGSVDASNLEETTFRDDLLEGGVQGNYYVSRRGENHLYLVLDLRRPKNGIFNKRKLVVVESYRPDIPGIGRFKRERLDIVGCFLDKGAAFVEREDFIFEYEKYFKSNLMRETGDGIPQPLLQ